MSATGQSEAELLARIHLELGGRPDMRLFRNNIGKAWVGSGKAVRSGGGVFLPHGRQYQFGLPPGSSDLIGLRAVTVTPEMVGQTVGLFAAVEVKSETGRLRREQQAFLATVQRFGGLAGVARSVDEALGVVGRETTGQTGSSGRE